MKSENIDMIVVHGSFSKPDMDIGVDEIRQWHLEKGWSDVGYHHVIRRDGTVEAGRSEDRQGAHAKAVNSHSLGICLVGGMDSFGAGDCNYTFDQYQSLWNLIYEMIVRHPTITSVVSHRDVDKRGKTCPDFDASEFYPMPEVEMDDA